VYHALDGCVAWVSVLRCDVCGSRRCDSDGVRARCGVIAWTGVDDGVWVCVCVHVHVWCDAVRCGVCAMGSRWELPPREEVASARAPRPYVPFEGRTTAQDAYVPKVLEDGGPTFGARRDTGAPPPERPYIPFEVSGVPGGQGGLGCVGVGRQGVGCACVCMCVDGRRHEQREGGKGEHVHVCAAVLVCWCACLVVWLCVALDQGSSTAQDAFRPKLGSGASGPSFPAGMRTGADAG